MNERIRELAEQAGFNVDFEPSDDENDREYQVVNNNFAEKFAELIIRECAYASWIGGNDNFKKILEYFEIK